MDDDLRLRVRFYRTDLGNEPVRDWLKALPREERRTIGEDIKTAQFGWPLGMPLIRKLEADLWEVRSRLDSRIARVIFTVQGDQMILLHGLASSNNRRRPRSMSCASPVVGCARSL